jgi:hypothetical protein
MTKLGEIQEAILRLDPKEQQVLRHWLYETAEETPEMLAAIDEGLHSLATEGGVPIAEARRHLRECIGCLCLAGAYSIQV